LSAINEIIRHQNKRLSFLKNYGSKDPKEKLRTVVFKEQMDKEEITHLEREIEQLQEIAEHFYYACPAAPSEPSSHSITKSQSTSNFGADVTNVAAASVINSKESSILKDELPPSQNPGKPSFASVSDHRSMDRNKIKIRHNI